MVQLPTAQINHVQSRKTIPPILATTTFTNHVEIINRCKTDDERIFYMLYASQQRLKTEELRRCIVNQTYASLMGKEKMLSPKMIAQYPNTEFMLKDNYIRNYRIKRKIHTVSIYTAKVRIL